MEVKLRSTFFFKGARYKPGVHTNSAWKLEDLPSNAEVNVGGVWEKVSVVLNDPEEAEGRARERAEASKPSEEKAPQEEEKASDQKKPVGTKL